MQIEPSLKMIEGIQWKMDLLNNLAERLKIFIHPEHGKEFRIDENISLCDKTNDLVLI
jgi:hypothetical protein